jgi:RHS repeat-associated protein
VGVAAVGNSSLIGYYKAVVQTANDFYPGGMQMPGRKYSSTNKYRYSFNGKEHDDEIAGAGNSIHYEFRDYDPRIGRFKSTDPRSPDYAWQSPYVYHRNNPINAVDYMGLGDPPTLNWDYFNQRHTLSGGLGANTPKGGVTSVVTNPAWQNKFAIEGFFNEAMSLAKATGKTETNVTLKNGTTWSINTKSGHFNPISGEGITNLSNAEVAVIRAAKKGGATGEAIFENLAKNKSLTGTFSEGMQTAMNSLAKIEGVSEGAALKHIGGNMSAANVSAGQTSAAASRFGSAGRYIKWGGRALLVVAVASDVYEVYNSENKARTITKKVGGWAAAGAAAAGAGVAMSWFEAAPGPGTIAHGIVTLGAGIGGYFIGETVTETVYDWIFTPVK